MRTKVTYATSLLTGATIEFHEPLIITGETETRRRIVRRVLFGAAPRDQTPSVRF